MGSISLYRQLNLIFRLRFRKFLIFILLSIVSLLISCSTEDLTILVAKQASLEVQKTVSLKITNYCPTASYAFRDFFGRNISVHIDKTGYLADRDRDGLPNIFEIDQENIDKFDIHYKTDDSNSDCHSDFIVVKLGFDYIDQRRLELCENPYSDLDNDRLWDADEDILKTDTQKPDNDSDGIPDGYEVLIGTSPQDKNDALLDGDNDGFNNIQEWHMGTPINISNTDKLNSMAYQYAVANVVFEDKPCYDLTLSNIPIFEINRTAVADLDNGNYIDFLIFELSSNSVQKMRALSVVVSPYIEHDTEIVIDQFDESINYLVGKDGLPIEY